MTEKSGRRMRLDRDYDIDARDERCHYDRCARQPARRGQAFGSECGCAAEPANPCLRLEGIVQRNEAIVRLWLNISDQCKRSEIGDANRRLGRRFREDGPTITEQNQQIGAAVIIDVHHRFCVQMRRRIEFLDQVDLAVEVSIRFAANQDALRVVVLLDIGTAVEITVDRYLGEVARLIVSTPLVWTSVAVAILGPDVLSAVRKCQDRCRGTGAEREDRREPGDSFHRRKST